MGEGADARVGRPVAGVPRAGRVCVQNDPTPQSRVSAAAYSIGAAGRHLDARPAGGGGRANASAVVVDARRGKAHAGGGGSPREASAVGQRASASLRGAHAGGVAGLVRGDHPDQFGADSMAGG